MAPHGKFRYEENCDNVRWRGQKSDTVVADGDNCFWTLSHAIWNSRSILAYLLMQANLIKNRGKGTDDHCILYFLHFLSPYTMHYCMVSILIVLNPALGILPTKAAVCAISHE